MYSRFLWQTLTRSGQSSCLTGIATSKNSAPSGKGRGRHKSDIEADEALTVSTPSSVRLLLALPGMPSGIPMIDPRLDPPDRKDPSQGLGGVPFWRGRFSDGALGISARALFRAVAAALMSPRSRACSPRFSQASDRRR